MKIKEQSTPRSSMADILQGMESFENAEYTPEERKRLAEGNSSGNYSYDEQIPASLAHTILGNDYEPNMIYKLVTQRDSTVVLKIDPSIPDGTPNKYDANGNIVEAKIREYPLESPGEVMSYGDMQRALATPTYDAEKFKKIPLKKKSKNFWPYFVAIMSLLAIGWCMLMYFVLSVFGGM